MNAVTAMQVPGLQWSEDGCASLHGSLHQWATRFDAKIAAWASGQGAGEYRFPSLIAARSLAPIAYLRSFPHLATFVTSGDRREEALRSLAEECGTAEQIEIRDNRFAAIGHLLTPAACYHFYPRLAGERLASPLLLTTRCQCFRREEHYLPLQRQWCFEMRELVCIGNGERIDRFVTECTRAMQILINSLGIEAEWQSATDPFFDPQGDPKALAQIIEPSKRELCTSEGLAIASINQHRSFFGESYDIQFDNRTAESACVAFGIERWLHAMLGAHGVDAGSWPQPELAQ